MISDKAICKILLTTNNLEYKLGKLIGNNLSIANVNDFKKAKQAIKTTQEFQEFFTETIERRKQYQSLVNLLQNKIYERK